MSSDVREHIVKVVGTVVVSSSVVGIAYLIFVRSFHSKIKKVDKLLKEIEKLRIEVDQLRIDLRRGGGTPISSRSPLKKRERSVTFTATGCGDAETPDVMSHAYSVTSISSFSDSEFADAEEEWSNGTVTIPCLYDSSRPSITIPSLSFDDIDKLFGGDDIQKAYDLLKKRYDNGENGNAEVLWRLAKSCHELAGRSTNAAKKKELIFEGKKYGVAAAEVNNKSFNALKWAAVMTGLSTDHLGTKEKIEQGGKFKEYLDKALAMEPTEFSLLHMRGRFSYSVAQLSWLERKAAAVFFATPPTATIDEALTDFLAANVQKAEWIENLVYIGRCYKEKGDKANCKKYLLQATKIEPMDEAERGLIAEANKLIAKC